MAAHPAGRHVEVGITDHAQQSLGDLVFVEVPEPGRHVAAGDACAVVESVKAASDIYSPVSGEVTAGNPKLATEPDLINRDPYGEGWIMRVKPSGGVATETLDSAAYEAVAAAGG